MGFFDDLTKKASETYKNTTEKTSKLTREMKLKSLINDNKNKIDGVYAEIGKKIYEKHLREENIDIRAELAEECAKIGLLGSIPNPGYAAASSVLLSLRLKAASFCVSKNLSKACISGLFAFSINAKF